MEKYLYTTAYVKSSDDSARIKVKIYLDQALPLFTIGGETVGAYESSIKTEVNLRDASLEPNLLIGINSEDGSEVSTRFTPIAVIKSMATGNEAMIYFDTITKYMFMIPSMKYYFTGDSSDANLNTMSISIKGQYIGAKNIPGTGISALTEIAGAKTNISTPVNAVQTTKNYLIMKPGLSRYSDYNVVGQDLTTYFNMGTKHAPVEFVSLGSTENLLGLNIKAPLYRLAPNSFNDSNVIFIGNAVSSDILIPINF